MTMRLATFSAVLLAPALAAAQGTTPAPKKDSLPTYPVASVVAIVNAKPITEYDLGERFGQRIQEMMKAGKQPPGKGDVRFLVDTVLANLIDEELMLAKAADLKVDVPDAQVLPYVNQQFRTTREQFPSETEFRQALAQYGIGTPDEYRRFLTESVRRQQTFEALMKKLREENKLIMPNITDKEIESAFESMKGSVPTRSPQITWRQLVLAPSPSPAARAAARAKAESLLAEIRRGGDFERIARRESMDPETKDIGGDRGFARRGDHEPEFDDVVFGSPARGMFPMKPGEVSRVVETVQSFLIVQLNQIRPGEAKTHYIVIKPAIDSADIARASVLADSLAGVIRAGTPLDSLTRRYHDYADDESAGLMPAMERIKLPDEYQKAFGTAKIGDVVSFPITGGKGERKFVIAQVTATTEGGPMPLAEVKERLRADLAQQGSIRRYIDSIRKEAYIAVFKDRAYAAVEAMIK